MKIVVDIGNSYVKVYYENDDYVVFPNTKDRYIVNNMLHVIDFSNVTSATICSVVPEVSCFIKELLKEKNINYKEITSEIFGELINFGGLDYKNMGADRVIVSYSAKQKYGNNIIVFDLGSAITVDVLVDNIYTTGYIIPGSDLQKRALTSGASMIDDIHFKHINKRYKALDTNTQISDGILIGICGSINSLLNVCSTHFNNNYKVILTGGSTKQLVEFMGEELIKSLIQKEVIIDTKLMHEGLKDASKMIWEKNES